MSNFARIHEFQEYSKTQTIITAVAHGELVETNNSFFPVPPGMTIIFISKPGYLIALHHLRNDPKFASLFSSETKMRKLIADKLPQDEIPKIIKHGRWSWKKHIYISGMNNCPNLRLEFYDELDPWYNEQCGVRYLGQNLTEYKGKKGTLKNLLSSFSQKGVLFVFACRGVPSTANETFKIALRHGAEGQPQKYKIPNSKFLETVKKMENAAARVVVMKRLRTPQNLKLKKRTISPPRKKLRTTRTSSRKKRSRSPGLSRSPPRKKQKVTRSRSKF